MSKKKGKKTMSIGQQIVRDLKKLNRVIASGDSVCDHFTCNRVVLNLQPRVYTPEMVKALRKSLGMSQAIFAQFIGVAPNTLRAWEQGQNPVPGMACRFFDELKEAPEHFRKRIREASSDKALVQSE